jgi:hypothetical protein
MGHELYRMIRDGAPPGWTPHMRLLAETIADDALDPSQHPPADGGWPRSAIRVRGGRSRSHGGEWYDGLTERTGMSERAISRALTALARAGYEMREQIGTDRRGRPVFAYPGRTPRFRVPQLTPRGSPPSTATSEARQVRRPSEARQGRRPRKVAKSGDHGSPPNMASKVAKSGELQTLLPNPSNPTSPDLQVVNSNLEGSRDRQDDDFDDFSNPEKTLTRWGLSQDQARPALDLIARLCREVGVDVGGYLRSKSGSPAEFTGWLTGQLARQATGADDADGEGSAW